MKGPVLWYLNYRLHCMTGTRERLLNNGIRFPSHILLVSIKIYFIEIGFKLTIIPGGDSIG